MKRVLYLQKVFFALLIALGLGLETAYAYDFSAVCSTGQTLYYNIIDATNRWVEIVDPVGSSCAWCGVSTPEGDITLPTTVTHGGVTYTVKKIGSNAFATCNRLTGSLTIPSTVTEIEVSAFADCSGFTGSLTLPSSITYIGDYTFIGCGFTGTLTIPSSVTWIGDCAFQDCSGFTGTLTIPSSVTFIGWAAFKGCTGFSGSLTIPNQVTTIDDYAFEGCTGFTGTLTIPNSVTEIGLGAFDNCSGFSGSLTIGSSVTSIGKEAFRDCFGFTQVNYNAVNCADVASDDKPFENCGGTLVIGNDVQRIPSNMFKQCSGFTGSLTIPNSVTTIGDYAFYYCTGFMGSLTLGSSVTTIGDNAFGYCSNFTGSLTLPNAVTTIGDGSFVNCGGFTGDLTLGNSVTTIGDAAFALCDGFTGNLTIGRSVTTIGDGAFYNCDGFTAMTVYPEIPPTLGSSALQNVQTTIPVYVLCASLEDYQAATGWSAFTNMHCIYCSSEDQCELTFTLTDSYGDTWNGNAIRVVDVETGDVLATMTNVTNDHPNAPITETYTLPVCDGRELRFEWVKGTWATECSYTITDANGMVILQGTGNNEMNTGDVLLTYTVDCTPIYIFLTDGDWNDGNHWNTGTVPPAGYDVIIQANATVPAGYLAVANEVTLDGGSITLDDGGQLKHNTLDLVVTMKKNIVGYDDANDIGNYYLLAFPFFYVEIPAAMTADEGSDFYRFDSNESDAEWRNHRNHPISSAYRGDVFLYANPDSLELSLTGSTLSTSYESAMDQTIEYYESSGNIFNGWKLLGNPFTYNAYVYRRNSDNELEPMPIMMYDAEGVLQTIYGGPVTPMQGFFVHVTETTTVCFRGTGHGYVDLGLPSGTLWATCNVGADTPEGYGDYFAWGETEPKDYYHSSTYLYCSSDEDRMTKYCNNSIFGYNGFTDDLTTLLPEDDAATANWGYGWRMPTDAEFEELYNNTTVTWTTQKGVYGRLFTAANGNSLFLPAAGYRSYGDLNNAGSVCRYWSSSLCTYDPRYALFLGNNVMAIITRYYGQSVRPVRSSGQN